MQTEIIISGFGGQGVLFAGQLLAYCALDNDKHVTWFPSYGPEMRGGTAHCTVIISDEEIGSPVVKNPSAAIVMNLPSLDKYEPLIKEGGLLVVNSSLVDRSPDRTDIDVLEIAANEIAEELGNRRLINLVLVGALLQKLPIFTVEVLSASLDKHIPDRHRNMLELNISALNRGFREAEGERISV
jgi:2-oxoglutarate ferredoxin oxidoreductase subunit gamma